MTLPRNTQTSALRQFLGTCCPYDQADGSGYVPLELSPDDFERLEAFIAREVATAERAARMDELNRMRKAAVSETVEVFTRRHYDSRVRTIWQSANNEAAMTAQPGESATFEAADRNEVDAYLRRQVHILACAILELDDEDHEDDEEAEQIQNQVAAFLMAIDQHARLDELESLDRAAEVIGVGYAIVRADAIRARMIALRNPASEEEAKQ